MPSHKERRDLPYSADQMYALVADVARYSEFLPWVVAVRVRSDSETEMVADLIVGFKALKETFTSLVHKDNAAKTIRVEYIDGPLKHLHNDWRFTPVGSGCVVDFAVDFSFRNRLFEAVAGQYFDKALRRMTDAFIARADALYGVSGNNNSSATSAA